MVTASTCKTWEAKGPTVIAWLDTPRANGWPFTSRSKTPPPDADFLGGRIHDPKVHGEDLFKKLHILRGDVRNVYPRRLAPPEEMSAPCQKKSRRQSQDKKGKPRFHIRPPSEDLHPA